MPVPALLRRVFGRVRDLLPLLIEAGLTFSTARLALMLAFNQDYFETHRPYFDYLEANWVSQEWCLGTLAAAAALTNTAGLCISAASRSEADLDAAFMLRLLGWGGYVLIYGAIAASISIGELHSLASILSTLTFAFALTGFLMGPAMPDEAHDGR